MKSIAAIDLILKIIEAVKIPIQIAGGIRTINTVNKFLEKKKFINVVLGTMAFKEPESIKKMTRKKLCRIIIAVDHYNEDIMISGWKEFSGMKLFEAIKLYQEVGVNNF